MKEVTDPALLSQLEAGGREVTDPALLSQLEGGEVPHEGDPKSLRFLRGVADIGYKVGDLLDPLASRLEDKFGTLGGPSVEEAQANRERRRAEADQGAPSGVDWMRLGGQAVATAPLGEAKVAQGISNIAPKAAALFDRAASGAVTGAAISPDGETGQGATTGAIVNSVLPPVLGRLGKVVGGMGTEAANKLRSMGVDLTPGQLLGGAAQRIEQGMTSIPVLGDFIKNRTRESFESLNRAIADHALAPIGESLPKDVPAGHDAVAFAERKIGDRYDQILSQGAIDVRGRVINNLNQMVPQVASKLSPELAQQFKSIVQNEVAQNIKPSGMIDGDTYKGIDSNLRRIVSQQARKDDYFQNQLGDAVKSLKDYLRTEFDTQNPVVADSLKPVDEAWAKFKRLQTAASYASSEGGVATPERLMSAVRAGDRSKDKAAFAKGTALMQGIAENAKQVMGNKVPDSGTPFRSAIGLTLGGLGAGALGEKYGVKDSYLLPMAVALAGGSAAYSKAGTKLLSTLIADRPQVLGLMGGGLEKYAGPIGSSISPATMELLKQLSTQSPQP